MKPAALLLSLTAVFIAITRPLESSPPVLSNPNALPDLVEKVLPGVVNISSITVTNYQVYGMDEFLRFWRIPREHKTTSLGSGFVIDSEGHVITNHHVVAEATDVIVTTSDKTQYRAKIIGRDQKTDLALLQIRDKDLKVPAKLQAVPFGDSDTVRIAESAFAVGNPFGLQHTVTIGIISAKNRTIGLGPFDNFLQTDASINPGNSGGPLFNLRGEVIGVNTVIYSKTGQSGGLGFAIPSNEVKRIVPDLKKYGRVPRPWLGILAQQITPQIAAYYDLKVPKTALQGVLIVNLVQRAPADRARLKRGDVIVSIAGTEVSEPADIERALGKNRPKDTVRVKAWRGERAIETEITLEELPSLDEIPEGII